MTLKDKTDLKNILQNTSQQNLLRLFCLLAFNVNIQPWEKIVERTVTVLIK